MSFETAMRSSLRILHLIHTPRHSGAESLVRDLSLLGMEQGVPSAIASFTPCEPPFEADRRRLVEAGVEVYFPNQPLTRPQRVLHYRRAMATFRPDAIFGHSVLPSFYGRLSNSARRHRAKFISVLHSASNDDYAGALLHLSEKATRPMINAVVAVSDQGKANYLGRFGDNIPVRVIRNGIDLGRFKNLDRVSLRAKLGVPDSKKIVIQVGRIDPVKQQHLSYEALKCKLEEHNMELWFVGLTENSSYENSIKEQVKKDSLANRVKFLGSRDDVNELLTAADVFVMPSLAEAHSIAMLEALASGIPIVASDIPAFDFLRRESLVHIFNGNNPAELRNIVIKAKDIEKTKPPLDQFEIGQTFNQYYLLAQEAQ